MSDRVFTLAVWDVAARRWAALATSSDRARIDLLHSQLAGLVMVFTEVVEVLGTSDDDVVASLALLPKVHPEAVFTCYFDLVAVVSGDQLVGVPPPVN